ncbi:MULTISPECIES: penicillin-binding protein activator LpoB [Myxococcus]|uniref:Penicillin-binding protein activator LpoB n=1 Tax=Myxococcus llanfairpwllgwyngyllgogerychwyrndrobwllllantysiliogogogochensis TaxID=2590453 RepID=A0A540WMT6_9BACT|nr:MULTISPECIES: penicillin-binding protein activator LpoB [Myxococcus]NTX00686.1 penicillin-binding protein activator LpoB [Myxococcus sp. CA040A]TQF10321.1 penicillin-binding protein activator LpoB [Myxococcus llanfairpwllgwyngyllgogerychwyrndrobwllllantysiliogogogochensis]
MKTHRLILTACLAASLVACSGPRAYTRGSYEDPNEIEMLSDQFNENDLQLIAKKMAESLANSPRFSTPRPDGSLPIVLVGKLKNSTSEHIDMRSLGDKIQTALAQTGRFAMVDQAARQDIAEEYEYQQSGYVDPNAAKGPGAQVSVDFMMTGDLASIIQEVGRDKLVYYKMTAKLSNVRTGLIEWTDEKQIRKKFEKRGVSW